ncbi:MULTISPECIES: hypothetical protein [unclassified Micromonospora]|uniref:hypothetical protein n=1 Tax=unclassified Micromonospora TaxID=2617518 RepID=UPI003A882964
MSGGLDSTDRRTSVLFGDGAGAVDEEPHLLISAQGTGPSPPQCPSGTSRSNRLPFRATDGQRSAVAT